MGRRKTNSKWSEIPVGQTISIPELRMAYGLEKSLLVDTAIRNFLGRQVRIGCVERRYEPGKFDNEVFQMRYTKIKEEEPIRTRKKKVPEPLKYSEISAADLGVAIIDSFSKMKEELKLSKEELLSLKEKVDSLNKENEELKLSVKHAEKEKVECQLALDAFVAKYNSKSINLKDVMTIHS